MKMTKNLKILIFILIFIVLIASLAIIYKKPKVEPENQVYVYFTKLVNKEKSQIAPVIRQVKPGENSLKTALVELLKGPNQEEKEKGYFTEIPVKTRLLEIKESPDKVVINLSEDFEKNGGSASMIIRLEQFNYTVLGVVQDKPVYLELNGKKTEYIGGEGVEVSQPLKKSK